MGGGYMYVNNMYISLQLTSQALSGTSKPRGPYVQCYRAKRYHEKIEILNYDSRVHSEHVFRSLMTPGV